MTDIHTVQINKLALLVVTFSLVVGLLIAIGYSVNNHNINHNHYSNGR